MLRTVGRSAPGLFLFVLLLNAPLVFAQTVIEFTPALSVGEEFDDNIYLDNQDKVSDFITTVSPSFNLSLLSHHTNLGVTYSPSVVRYADETDNDTVRHSGALTFGRDLTQNLRLDVSDSFLRTEEPLERTAGLEGVVTQTVRRERNPYWTNNGTATARYTFAPGTSGGLVRPEVVSTTANVPSGGGSAVAVGYANSLLEYSNSGTSDNGVVQTPFAAVSYWFNNRNGVELDYEYETGNFWGGEGATDQDDYEGNATGLQYLYRFNPHVTGALGYRFVNRDFQGDEEDFVVHTAFAGLAKEFSPTLTASLGGGYFIQEPENSDSQSGYVYSASLTKQFLHATLFVSGRGGWDESYLASNTNVAGQPTGFTRYWSGEGRFESSLAPTLDWHTGGYYRLNKEDQGGRQWSVWEGNLGLGWRFMRWFSLGLDYYHTEQDDDVDANDYEDNRVMLVITASTLYRW